MAGPVGQFPQRLELLVLQGAVELLLQLFQPPQPVGQPREKVPRAASPPLRSLPPLAGHDHVEQVHAADPATAAPGIPPRGRAPA